MKSQPANEVLMFAQRTSVTDIPGRRQIFKRTEIPLTRKVDRAPEAVSLEACLLPPTPVGCCQLHSSCTVKL